MKITKNSAPHNVTISRYIQ